MTVLEHLVVRLPEEPGNATWVVLDSAGHRLSAVERGSLEEAAAAASNRRVLLLVSGLDAVRMQSSLPVRSAARLRQMLPYSLEEAVAEDVERLHFAIGSEDDSGNIPVTMVARERMKAWLEDCERAGLRPERMYSESDGVPTVPESLTLVAQGDCILGRAPGQAPFTLQGMAPQEVMRAACGRDGEPAEIPHVILYVDTEGHARYEADVERLRDQGVRLDIQLLREGILPRLGATLIDRPGCNLLQGSYNRQPDWRSWVRPWRYAAALVVGALALAMVAEGARYLTLSREARAVTVLIETACRRNVGTADLGACETEIRRRLAPAAAGDGTGFLLALDAVAQAWNQDARLQALSFRSGVMDLRMVADDVSSLDEFARDLSDDGSFQSSIQSANPAQDGILGRLRIEPGS